MYVMLCHIHEVQDTQHCLLKPELTPLQLGYGVLGIVMLQRQGQDTSTGRPTMLWTTLWSC